jgi:hypothetical protein
MVWVRQILEELRSKSGWTLQQLGERMGYEGPSCYPGALGQDDGSRQAALRQ